MSDAGARHGWPVRQHRARLDRSGPSSAVRGRRKRKPSQRRTRLRYSPARLRSAWEAPPRSRLAELADTVFCDPATEEWQTADAYLSGPVRHKLAAARAAAALDRSYAGNVAALQAVQPHDVR